MAPKRIMQRGQASNTNNIKKMVKDIVESRLEHKRATITTALTAVATAGAVVPMTQKITQGSDLSNRDGDMILINELWMIFQARNADNTFLGCSIRSIVFADNMNNGTAVAVTDVLQTAGTTSWYNLINQQKNRFKIYYDHTFDCTGQTSNSHQTVHLKFNINRKCFYSADGDIAGANGKGALFLLVISDNADADFLYKFTWGMKYTDA